MMQLGLMGQGSPAGFAVAPAAPRLPSSRIAWSLENLCSAAGGHSIPAGRSSQLSCKRGGLIVQTAWSGSCKRSGLIQCKRAPARSCGSGCPFCENRRIGATNSLGAVNPELAQQWHQTKNGSLTPYNVPPSGARVAWWKCPNGDDHEWKMSVNARASGSKSGCPFCDGKQVSKGNSLEAKHLMLAKEWHPSKNGSLLPSQVTARSGKIAWWVCDRKHDYRARVADRVAGRRCGQCRNQTSQFELRLLAELESLFENGQVLHRHKVGGVECDIFIAHLSLAIEVDGGHWHKAREPEDRRKNSVLEAEGVSCLRVRGPGLSLIGPHDVMITKGEESNPNHEVISRVVEGIVRLAPDPSLQILARQYQVSTGFRNPQRFNKLMWDIAKPAKGAALSDRAPPELLAEWHPTLNQPLEPADLSYGSGRKVWWLCAAKGHAWEASVDNRMKGNGCHHCYKGRGRSKTNLQLLPDSHPSTSTLEPVEASIEPH